MKLMNPSRDQIVVLLTFENNVPFKISVFRNQLSIAIDEKGKPMNRTKATKKMANPQYDILHLLKKGPNSEYCEFI
jgi:hypothetical protein